MASLSSNNNFLGTVLSVLSLLFLLSVGTTGLAQNLVLNPSFEDYVRCPTDEGQFNGYVEHWNTYFSTPDFNHECGRLDPILDIIGIPDGEGVVNSKFSVEIASPREYLHGNLMQALVAGQRYYVEYYIYQHDYGVATDVYHAHLTDRVIDEVPSDDVLRLTPHIAHQGGIVMPDSGWTAIHGCYLAQGGENKIVLGNFYDEGVGNSIVISTGTANMLLVDQVGVYAVDDLMGRRDTTLLVGDQLIFSVTDPRRYSLEDVGPIDTFHAEAVGCYQLYYTLPSCDLLDSFMVCVEDCPAVLELDLLGDGAEQRCLELDDDITLEIPDSLVICVNGREVDDLSGWRPERGTNTIIIKDICDLADTFTLVSAACCDEELVDSIICPVVPPPPPPPPAPPCTLYMPTAFSPNNDGINDRWRSFSSCDMTEYRVSIYDRYGAIVYESVEEETGWDGTFHEQTLDPGVFVYVIDYVAGEEVGRRVGEIQLVR